MDYCRMLVGDIADERMADQPIAGVNHPANAGSTPLVLLCPAWKKHGTATTVKQKTTILHSRADDVVPFSDSEELVRISGLPASSLVEVGNDHRLADLEPLKAMRPWKWVGSLACGPE